MEKHILEDEAESRGYIVQAWTEARVIYKNCSHELKLSKDWNKMLDAFNKAVSREKYEKKFLI